MSELIKMIGKEFNEVVLGRHKFSPRVNTGKEPDPLPGMDVPANELGRRIGEVMDRIRWY